MTWWMWILTVIGGVAGTLYFLFAYKILSVREIPNNHRRVLRALVKRPLRAPKVVDIYREVGGYYSDERWRRLDDGTAADAEFAKLVEQKLEAVKVQDAFAKDHA